MSFLLGGIVPITNSVITASAPANFANAHITEARSDIGNSLLNTGDTGLVFGDRNIPPVFEYFHPPHQITESFCLDGPLHDIYFRVYVSPSEVPLGVIGSEVQVELTLWNAQIEPLEITNVFSTFDIDDGEGNELVFPFGAGETQLFRIRVLIPQDGPAGQSEEIAITFSSNGQLFTRTVPISLIRAVVWHFPPHFEQWSQTYTFRTAITITEDGTEQRHSLTPYPIMTFGAEYWTVGEATPDIRAVQWSESQVIAGDWSRSMVLSEPARKGDTAVQLRAFDVWMHPEQKLIFVDGTDPTVHRNELVEALPAVEELPGTLSLANTLTMDWPAGTRVVPAHFALFTGDSEGEHRTNCFYVGDSDFRALDLVRLPEIEPPMLDGIPVFEKFPNWNTLPTWRIGHERNLIEGINKLEAYNNHNRGRSASGFQFWFKGQDQIHELLGWINVWRGRWKTFYMPTWVNDLNAVESAGSLLTRNRSNAQPQQRYNLDRGRDAVFVVRGDQLRYGKIIGAVITAETTVFTTEPALPTIRNPGVAGYLQEVRLQDDSVTIDFQARDLAVLTLNVQTV